MPRRPWLNLVKSEKSANYLIRDVSPTLKQGKNIQKCQGCAFSDLKANVDQVFASWGHWAVWSSSFHSTTTWCLCKAFDSQWKGLVLTSISFLISPRLPNVEITSLHIDHMGKRSKNNGNNDTNSPLWVWDKVFLDSQPLQSWQPTAQNSWVRWWAPGTKRLLWTQDASNHNRKTSGHLTARLF